MQSTVTESDYSATQAIFGAVLFLSGIGMATTLIVAKLGGIL